MELTDREWISAEKELCARSLSEFVKLAWHVIEPAQPYVHGWHIDAISEHLQAVTEGKINRLLINCPPGAMKSLLVGVFWPMWEWGPRGLPHMRIVGASHSQNFAMRDNLRARRIVFSSWFQERWPTPLTNDQDTKMKFENMKTGWRAALAVSSMTGERGDRVIFDDPHSVESAVSDAERRTTVRIFQETVTTRLNNPDKSAIVVVMQRLHQHDVAGHILSEGLGYEHLMLPMEFEPERACKTSIGFVDPRKKDGDLLFPERFSREVVDRDIKALGGPIAASGQFQQRPAPRGGAMIPWQKFQIIPQAPEKMARRVRYWDKAGTEGAGARTAGVLMGMDDKKRIYILNVVKGQWSAVNREDVIKLMAGIDGKTVPIMIEQEPGSGGKESAEATIRNLAGWVVKAERPTGDKALRAEPFAVQVQAENVYLVAAEWNKDFIEECQMFPQSKFKDQVDATSGALMAITSARLREVGVLPGMRV